MNNGAFGENFPYSNFHDLNMDWIIKIAKDFLDQYTHIEELIETGIENIQTETTEGLEELQEKADALTALLDQWYNTHSEDIAEQLADALSDLNSWYTEHIGFLNDYLTLTINRFNESAEAKARETIATIPSDYTALSDNVLEIDNELDHIRKIESSINLADPSDEVGGILLANGTVDLTYPNYFTTKMIPINPTTHYTLCTFVIENGAISNSRKRLALYDADGVFISDTYIDTTDQYTLIYTPSTAKYVRMSRTNHDELMLTLDSTEYPVFYEYYKKYISEMELNPNNKKYLVEQVVFNQWTTKDQMIGKYLTSNGVLNNSANYNTTDYIPVSKGVTYSFNATARKLAIYDTNKTFGETLENLTSYVPPYDGFIRISYIVATPITQMTSSFNGTYETKNEEGISLSSCQLTQARRDANQLSGKKWAVAGDSFTNGVSSATTIQEGKYAGKRITYPWIIGNRNNMNVQQFFLGGMCLAYPANPTQDFINSFTCPENQYYYQNIPADTDIITIYLGINDAQHSTGENIIPLGTIDDNDTSTYYGAWNVVLTWLITNRPNAHIGIIVCNGLQQRPQYRTAQIEIANKYGIPYIDLNGDSRTPAMLRTSNPNIPDSIKLALLQKWSYDYPDNTHPSDDAHIFESEFIETFLKSI